MQKIGHQLSLAELLAATKFAVEATSFERNTLWRDNHHKVSWCDNTSGHGVQLDQLDGRPVMLSLWFQLIDEHVVLFYEPTSQVVDYRMVEAWLDRSLPSTEGPETRRLRTDATNFHVCLHALAELNKTANALTTADSVLTAATV